MIKEALKVLLDDSNRHAGGFAFKTLEPSRVGDKEFGLGQVESVPDFICGPPPVHPNDHPSERHGRPKGQDPFGCVGGKDRDAIPFADAVLITQRRSNGRNVAQVICVCPAAPVRKDEVIIACKCLGAFKQLTERTYAVLVDAHRYTENGFFNGLERAIRPRQFRASLFPGRKCRSEFVTHDSLRIRNGDMW